MLHNYYTAEMCCWTRKGTDYNSRFKPNRISIIDTLGIRLQGMTLTMEHYSEEIKEMILTKLMKTTRFQYAAYKLQSINTDQQNGLKCMSQ